MNEDGLNSIRLVIGRNSAWKFYKWNWLKCMSCENCSLDYDIKYINEFEFEVDISERFFLKNLKQKKMFCD